MQKLTELKSRPLAVVRAKNRKLQAEENVSIEKPKQIEEVNDTEWFSCYKFFSTLMNAINYSQLCESFLQIQDLVWFILKKNR